MPLDTPREKIRVLIVCGMHPRELISTKTCETLIDRAKQSIHVCTERQEMSLIRLLEFLEILVVPVANPDGVAAMEQKHNDCVRKNANRVDLNRNFDWNWGGQGSSSSRYSEEYRGRKPFSEPETAALKKLFQKSITVFLDIHSGTQQLFIPFVDENSKKMGLVPPALEDQLEIVRHVEKHSNGRYTDGGIGYKLNDYVAAGTAFDWASGMAGVKYSFCWEVWGWNGTGSVSSKLPENLSCYDQFNPRKEDMSDVAEKIVDVIMQALYQIVSKEVPSFTLGENDIDFKTYNICLASHALRDARSHVNLLKHSSLIGT